MEPLRVAVIGSWGHVAIPLDACQRVDGVRIVGLAPAAPDDNPDNVRRQIAKAVEAPVFSDYHQLLTQTRPDLAIIATRLDRIAPVAIEAAGKGCHLICEKPLSIEHALLGELFQVVTSRCLHCLPILTNRQHPVLHAAVTAVRAGRIGQVVLANARKSYKWGTRPEWFGDRRRYGGTIPWIGIHALDFVHAVVDRPFTAVAAMQSNAAHPQRHDCEDNCTLLLEMEGGAHATISIDYFRPENATTWGDDWLRVVGTKGTIEACMDRGVCLLQAEDTPQMELHLPMGVPAFDTFLEAIKQEQPYPPEQTRNGFILTHAALCARDAADQSQLLHIPAWD